MERLTIVAKIEAKEDQVDFVKSELLKLVDKTRAEKGCLQYDLHQDNKDTSIFLFYENWESKEDLKNHMNSDHIKAYAAATKDALKSFVVNEMTLIK